jgi:deoxycytidylate deaminase
MENEYDSNKIKGLLSEILKKEKVCMKHPIASLIKIDKKDRNNILRMYVRGWNGAPSGIDHYICLRKGYSSGEGMEKCPTIHAERRAISRAGRDGLALYGGTIYLSEWFPCADCAKSIIEAGIKRLVTPDEFYQNKEKHILAADLQNKPYNFELAEKLMRESGIEMIVDKAIGFNH